MAKLGLSRQARSDIFRIAAYGVETWGFDAADRFIASFDDAFALIERHPDIGRPREELCTGLRSWQHRGYILYYQHDAQEFEIRRIMHAAADPEFGGD